MKLYTKITKNMSMCHVYKHNKRDTGESIPSLKWWL